MAQVQTNEKKWCLLRTSTYCKNRPLTMEALSDHKSNENALLLLLLLVFLTTHSLTLSKIKRKHHQHSLFKHTPANSYQNSCLQPEKLKSIT